MEEHANRQPARTELVGMSSSSAATPLLSVTSDTIKGLVCTLRRRVDIAGHKPYDGAPEWQSQRSPHRGGRSRWSAHVRVATAFAMQTLVGHDTFALVRWVAFVDECAMPLITMTSRYFHTDTHTHKHSLL